LAVSELQLPDETGICSVSNRVLPSAHSCTGKNTIMAPHHFIVMIIINGMHQINNFIYTKTACRIKISANSYTKRTRDDGIHLKMTVALGERLNAGIF